MTDKIFKNIPLILAVFALFLSCESKIPVISSIDPKIGRMGDIITLRGSNFGDSREESYVTIAGISPTGSSYHLWQDDLIMVRVPELGESGLVYVHTGGRKSNGVLFSNSASVPRPVDGEEPGLLPRIISISPQTGAPGTLITINGSNFGVSREGGGVFFSWDYELLSFNPFVVREPEFVEVSEVELGYVSWNTREIQVRLPDGAVSGNIEVRTPHGRSMPVFFDVSGKLGNKVLTDKRSYAISYTVDIRVIEATRPNTLYLWIPMPVNSPSQRNVNLVSRNINPFVANYKGVNLLKMDNLVSGFNHSITHSFSVDVYTVETEIDPQSVRLQSNALPSISTVTGQYTQASALIPSDNPQIRATVNTIVGREQNPYIKARMLYDWILANIQKTDILFSSNDIAAITEVKRADPYNIVLLYTTMLRAAGVPCLPIAGILIDRNGQTMNHYWTEFWINDFGWIPADPVAGMGAVSVSFIARGDLVNYYFGNIDNQRIAFSRGELVLSQMDSRGRLVSHAPSFSLQNIWEEATGGLDTYTSLWGNITISGVYSQ
jgi:transglutaminase-like putative cysteine protease